jgi:hypothetical protein
MSKTPIVTPENLSQAQAIMRGYVDERTGSVSGNGSSGSTCDCPPVDSGIAEAPADGLQYARQDGNWSEVELPDVSGLATAAKVQELAEQLNEIVSTGSTPTALTSDSLDIGGSGFNRTIEFKEGTVDALAKANTALQSETDPFYTADKPLLALKTEIPNVSNFATQTELTAVANSIPNVSDLAKKTEIPDVSNLATKFEIPDISNLATKTELPDISDLATKESVEAVETLANSKLAATATAADSAKFGGKLPSEYATAAQGAKADSALQSFTETDPTVPAWAKTPQKPSYTALEVGAAPATHTHNYNDLENRPPGNLWMSEAEFAIFDFSNLPDGTGIDIYED